MNRLEIFSLVAILSAVMTASGYAGESMKMDSSRTTATSEQVVKGDVLTIEGEFYTVKDTTGHQVRLHVNKDTTLEGKFKVGAKIEARVTSDGHATSITLQIPQNGTMPLPPNSGPAIPQRPPEGSAF
jgi:hypothetical protein